MRPMRLALTILKCIPAVTCLLLLAAWVASYWWIFGYTSPWPNGANFLGASRGRVIFERHSLINIPGKLIVRRRPPSMTSRSQPRNIGVYTSITELDVIVPIPILLTFLLPFAIGLRNRFRFPLWSWFLLVAIIAGECVWYRN